jgi:hypothetical protein
MFRNQPIKTAESDPPLPTNVALEPNQKQFVAGTQV